MCQVIIKKKEGFGDFFEGWVPFLLEIKQKTGWLVGMCLEYLKLLVLYFSL